MGFLEAYKHLEKMCGEVLNDERRIGAYIDEMVNTPRGEHLVEGWKEDLKQLKHYRWVRNQIAHNPECSEENMCNSTDTQWIVDFYERIINCKDPLALYRKIAQVQYAPTYKSINTEMDLRQYEYYCSDDPGMYRYDHNADEQKKKSSGCAVAILIVVSFAIAAAAIVLVLAAMKHLGML